MSALGSLVVKLALEYAEYTKGLEKGSQESMRFAQNVQKSFDQAGRASSEFLSGMVKGAIAAAAAYVSVSAAIDRLKGSIDTLGKLDDMAQKTGSSVENLSKLQKVASAFGADFDGGVNVALNNLAKGMAGTDDQSGKTANALKALGVSAKDAAGNLRDPSEVMIDIAKRLQDYQDGANKAALVTDLFKKAGVELLPYLNDLAENVDKFSGSSAEAAKRAADFQDMLGLMKVKGEEFWTGLANDLLPTMIDFIGALQDTKKESDNLTGNSGLAEWADDVAVGFARLIDVAKIIPETLRAVGGSFESVWADIQLSMKQAATLNPLYIGQQFAMGNNPFKDLADMRAEREATVSGANKRLADLWNKPANTMEQNVLNRIASRNTTGENSVDAAGKLLGAGDTKKKLDYVSKDGSGADDKKKLEGELKAIQNAFQAEKDATAFSLTLMGELRGQDLIDLKTYEQAKIDAIQHGLASATKAYDAEIAALESYKAKAGKPEDRADADNKIADARAKKFKAQTDATNATTLALVQQDRAQSDLNRSLKDWVALQGYAAENAALGIEMMGRSQQDIEKITTARRIQLDVEERIRQAQKLSAKPIDRSGYDKAAADAIATANMLIDAKYQKSRDPWFNLTESVRAYGEEAANVGKQIGDAMTNAMKSAEDAWVTFVTTGKLSFSDLARSVIADLARIQAKQMIAALASSGTSGSGASFLSVLGSLAGAAVGSSGAASVDMGGGSGLTAGGGSGLSSMGGGTGLQLAGARAEGGPVWPNEPFLVGEKGPEIFYPQSFGSIAPNKALPAAMSQPAQKSIHISPVYQVTVHAEVDKASSERSMRNIVAEGNAELVDQLQRAGAFA